MKAVLEREQKPGLSVPELAWVARTLLSRAGRPIPGDFERTAGMRVRNVRRHAPQGLTVIYATDPGPGSRRAIDPRSARFHPVSIRTMKAWAWGAAGLVSVTVGERSLEGMRTRFDARDVVSADVEVQPSGRVYAGALDLAIDVFPADVGMPALSVSCQPTEGTPLWEALQRAGRVQLGEEGWRLRDAGVEPIRYKPGDRCVLLYHLILDGQSGRWPAALTVVGKLHAEPEQARFNFAVQEWLYGERDVSDSPLVPRPLAFVDELGLTLSEAVATQADEAGGGTADEEVSARPRSHGTPPFDPWRPRVTRGANGEVADVVIPESELRGAAAALARLHTRDAAPDGVPLRFPDAEVKDVRRRAERIAAANPEQAEVVLGLSRQLVTHLDRSAPPRLCLVHGSYKPSQLLFDAGEARVIDWDELVVGDPALDVGSFLAWLRPSGLWYGRLGSRAWFDASADAFVRSYESNRLALGADKEEILGILERARTYEASKLFKIAVRRVRYLNSPRPGELASMCQEIQMCLENTTRWCEALGRS